jgi:protein pelota
MKILSKNLKKGYVKLQIETLDDLWYLSYIVDQGDFVKGETFRKIKIGTDEKASQVKKRVFLKIKVENVEFHKYSNILRISGTVTEGPEDVPLGSYHTFSVEEKTVISLEKESFLSYQIEKLEEAEHQKTPKILICVMDRENAFFALSKKYGYDLLSSIEGDVEKKFEKASTKGSFYEDLIKIITEYSKRYAPTNIILASPAFFKEDLYKKISDEKLRKQIVLANCSSVKEDAVSEVLKRNEVQEILKQDRITKEANLLESLLKEISKNGKAVYSLKETENAITSGAVSDLLITDAFIQKKRQENSFAKIEYLMRTVDNTKGKIHILSSDFDAGKKLDGLGGIGALLRYNVLF